MVVEHMANKNILNNKVDDSVLKLFWTLSEGHDEDRIKASNDLVKHLSQKQGSEEGNEVEELSQPLNYSVERLVKGLSSSRKWARVGYSLALTKILREFPVLSVKHVMTQLDSHLQYSSHDQRGESGGIMLGQAFVYLCLIQSDRLFKGDGKEYISRVLKSLLKLGREKMYLQSICSQALVLLVQKCVDKVYKKRILPNIVELEKGWKNCSVDRLLLILACSQFHLESTKEILEKDWNYPLVCKKNFPAILDILMQCNPENKTYIPMIKLLVDQVDSDQLTHVWQEIGVPLLKGNQLNKQIGSHLFSTLMKNATTPQQIEELLCRNIREFITMVPGSIFIKISKALVLKTIQDKLKENHGNSEMEFTIVKCLFRGPTGPNLDKVTKTTTLSNIIKELSEKGYSKVFKMIEKCFKGQAVEGLTTTDSLKCKKRAVYLMSIRNSTGDQLLYLTKLLFLHGYFTLQQTSTDILHCDSKVKFDEEEVTLIQNSFHKTLSNFHLESSNPGLRRQQLLQLMMSIVEYSKELIENPEIASPRKKLSAKETEAFDKILVVVKDLKKKKVDKRKEEDEAFLFLFVFFGLQIITEKNKQDLSLVEDLHSCYKKSAVKTKKNNDEPEWIEVLTEVILSLMSQPGYFSRVIASTVFKLLHHHVARPNIVEQITNVLFSNLGDEGPMKFEDDGKESNDDDDDNDDDDSMESDDDDDDESDDDEPVKAKKLKKDQDTGKETKNGKERTKKQVESESESSDEDDMEAEDFNDGFRQTVKAALGVAAVDSNEEGSDSDLNDSDMEKMDEKLAEAFKSMRKPSRRKSGLEAEKQFLAFKTRVMDLLQILIKTDSPCQITISLVLPLLKIMNKAERKPGQNELFIRARKTFEILYKQKNIKDIEKVEKDEIFNVLEELVQFSTKVTNVQIVGELSNGVLYLLKLLLHQESDLKTKNKVLNFLQQNLSWFLYNKKEYRFHPSFFNNLFERLPKFFWPMNTTVLDVLSNDRIKVYNKTLACGYLSTLLHKKTCCELKNEEWSKFQNQILPVLKKFLLSFDVKENYKPKFLEEILNILTKMIHISPTVKSELGEDINDKLSSLKPNFSTNTRHAFNRYKALMFASAGKRSKRMERHLTQDSDAGKSKNGHDKIQENGESISEDEVKQKSHKPPKKSKKEAEMEENMDEEVVETPKKEKKLKKDKKRKSDEGLNGDVSPEDKKQKLSKSFHFENLESEENSGKKSKKKDRKRKISL